MEQENNNPWIEGAAVVLAAAAVGLGLAIFFGAVFVGLRWSLAAFGLSLSINQFLAGLFLLVLIRVVLSYLWLKGK